MADSSCSNWWICTVLPQTEMLLFARFAHDYYWKPDYVQSIQDNLIVTLSFFLNFRQEGYIFKL